MSKRSSEDMDNLFEDPSELIKAKKLKQPKKNKNVEKIVEIADYETAGPSNEESTNSKIAFDEVLDFQIDPAEKFNKIIRLSKTEGMGILTNSISIFRIVTKNGEESISSYQFGIKNSVIPNLIISLQKVLKEKYKK